MLRLILGIPRRAMPLPRFGLAAWAGVVVRVVPSPGCGIAWACRTPAKNFCFSALWWWLVMKPVP
jgi:hypothetical protein